MASKEVSASPGPGIGENQPGKPESGGDLVLIDMEKVDAAVRYLNERTILSGIELAKEVGEYVLRTFFDGDYANFADPSRSKATSFRALLAREDLLLGNATLYSFVRISHQLKFLPADLVTRLTLTQHRALLPLPDPERKQALARRALDEGWSAVVLAEEVRKEVPKSPRGRKPLPPLAKGIHAVAKALDVAFEGEGASVTVSKLGAGGEIGSGRRGGRVSGPPGGAQKSPEKTAEINTIQALSVYGRKHSPGSPSVYRGKHSRPSGPREP